MFVSPGEIAFGFYGVDVHYYGIVMACSILLGVAVAKRICESFYKNIDTEVIYDISPIVILGAIIGARLYYCLLSLKYYVLSPLEIFMVWQGGLSIHGALIGGLLSGLWYAKRHNLPFLKLCDIFTYGVVLGQALGRWGNFFNSEAFGNPTDLPWKLYIPIYKRPLVFLQNDFFHPTFLYESLADILIFLVLFFIVRKLSKGKDGIIFFTYLILYSIVRILIEQIRIDSVLNLFNIPVAQLISLVLLVIGSVGVFVMSRKNA